MAEEVRRNPMTSEMDEKDVQPVLGAQEGRTLACGADMSYTDGQQPRRRYSGIARRAPWEGQNRLVKTEEKLQPWREEDLTRPNKT